MEMNVELVGIAVLIIGGIASYVRLKVTQINEKERLDTQIDKQDKDHETLVDMQMNKDKELWDEMKLFQRTLFEIGQSLGRLEGKIDYLRQDHGN